MAGVRVFNGVYIVQGEVNLLVTAMRRNSRWLSHNHQNDDDHEPLIRSFSQLKDILSNICDLDEIPPSEFLGPFLEVIRSEETSGPITGLALASVSKFISYSLIDIECSEAASAVEAVADAVTHARFVGTEPGSDEVVLMKILHVLRTLLLSQSGSLLNNESVCEIMQSCFRICFEMRLSELLRKSAEHTLVDMVQLLFTRLPHFKEDAKWVASMRKLKMRTGGGGLDAARSGAKHRKRSSPKPKSKKSSKTSTVASETQSASNAQTSVESLETHSVLQQHDESQNLLPCPESLETVRTALSERESVESLPPCKPDSLFLASAPVAEDECGSVATTPGDEIKAMATTPVNAGRIVVDMQQGFQDTDDSGCVGVLNPPSTQEQYVWIDESHGTESVGIDISKGNVAGSTLKISREEPHTDDVGDVSDPVLVGVSSVEEVGLTHAGRGTWSTALSADDESNGEFINPRGVRFTSSSNTAPLVPYSLPCIRELLRFLVSLTNPLDSHNTDVMIHMGLCLLTVALETGADHLAKYNSLLSLIKDDLARHLFFLLRSERLSLFSASIRVCFLLFESLRGHLKLQLEMYITKLMELIVSDHARISYEQREIALESIVQLLRIPGLVTEIYLNYDCDLSSSGLFEDLMKLLSKNAFPVSGLFSTHLLSLDALLAVIDSIEQHCHHRVLTAASKQAAAVSQSTPGSVVSASQPTFESVASAAHASQTASEGGVSVEETKAVTVQRVGESEQGVRESELYERMAALAMDERVKGVSSPKVHNTLTDTLPQGSTTTTELSKALVRPNRMPISDNIPTEQQLNEIKHKKKIYQTGIDQFNTKPVKGISYLQDHGLLSTPLDPTQVVTFIRENPKLDKRQIGEYLSSKKNKEILEAYLKSFAFEDTRIDEALRMFLETFRLPGEAPVISYILEHFAEHWHKTNGEPFANADAAFTLSYAVIMLNVDQHNTNAKKQNIPMTCEGFKKNVSKVNGGEDFDQEMLEEMYTAVKHEEIVMPSEHTGVVRDNYMWKILQRRSTTKSGEYIHAPSGLFDHDLFSIVWGPTVAALSFVFDKSSDESIVQKAISGFRKCAMISAHYSMSDVFDNLVISLCKFTTLLSAPESIENMTIQFGNNVKAQVAARTVFGLAHRHSDILREGWRNILDCMLQLYRANMLAEVLVRVEDFVDPSGRISLIKEDKATQNRTDTGVLSSFYSYFTLSETTQPKAPSVEDQACIECAHRCIQECHVEQLIVESKFLRVDSLQELIKALIYGSRCPDVQESMGAGANQCDEDAAVLCLELLIKVVLQNRDRMLNYWQSIQDHLFTLIVNSHNHQDHTGTSAAGHSFLMERAVVGLLRLAIRLLRREEIANQVLSSLRMLLMMKAEHIHAVSKQVSYGLHDLLKTNAANIHNTDDWLTLFTLLEVVGAGSNPPPVMHCKPGVNVSEVLQDAGAQSDTEIDRASNTGGNTSDRGYTSDSEIYERSSGRGSTAGLESGAKPVSHGSWLMVYNEEADSDSAGRRVNQYSIVLSDNIKYVCTRSLLKSSETLAFLVRDAAHVTPHNFESCVHAIRMFVEASVDGGLLRQKQQQAVTSGNKRSRGKQQQHESGRETGSRMRKSRSSPSHLSNKCDSDEELREADNYQTLSIQLLDLMHTLHTRAAGIFSSWAEEERLNLQEREGATDTETERQTNRQREQERDRRRSASGLIDCETSHLWAICWCPLLQGIARLCCDTRRHVRSQALTYLQRALLVHDLQTLSAAEWECCFNKVLFPLLSKLLENINPQDVSGVEETRMRASTLLCKVFLQHLTPLLGLTTFTALWLTILEFMDKYMHADSSDLLMEAIPESLKNMLLVMHTAGILSEERERDREGGSKLWKLTWDRIDSFLPNLRDEVFKPHHQPATEHVQTQQPQSVSPPPHSSTERIGAGQQTVSTTDQSLHATSSAQSESAADTPTAVQIESNSSTLAAATAPQLAAAVPPIAAAAVDPGEAGLSGGQYVLHPPLPSVSPHDLHRAVGLGAGLVGPIGLGLGPGLGSGLEGPVPLLLNPDLILTSTSIPAIYPGVQQQQQQHRPQ